MKLVVNYIKHVRVFLNGEIIEPTKYIGKANPIDVNWNDKRIGIFYYIWNKGGRVIRYAKNAPNAKLRYYVRYMV